MSTAAAVALLGVTPANAVDGVSSTPNFELEATVPQTTGATSDPNAVSSSDLAGDDWQNVFNGTSSANASRFLTDGFNSSADEKLFTGGQSKDPEDITSWRWTSPTGVQDKNDIEHAFAARYNATATNPAYLFFGLDRFASDGSATLGFWFLQGETAPVTVNGVNKFSGTGHRNNDLLVQINYSNGGTVPTVAVSRWFNGGLDPLANSNTALCGASTSQTFCASTNQKSEESPWLFTLKGASGDSSFAPRTFFEGGVNLAALNLDRQCFSTFVAETRSSNPFTSTLSDFVMGNFASCTASMTTTPSANETTNVVSPGTPVTDTATITGSGVTDAPFPSSATTAPGTGNKVNFHLCAVPTGTCTATSSNLISSEDLTPSTTQGTSTATSDAVNTSSNPLAPGRYCWTATWGGDSNYPAIARETNSSAECFVVRTIPTTTVTQPQDGSGAPLGTTAQLIGSTVYDHAVVTANGTGGGPIAGNVAFFICNPTQVVGGVCPNGVGTAAGNPAVTPVASSNPPSATADSTGVVVNQIGLWCFRATFTPTGSTYTGSSDGSVGECFSVRDTTTATSVQNWLPNDTATITASNASTPVAGTINMTLYPTSDCTGDAVSGQSYTSDPLSGTGSISFTTSNTTYRVNTPGTTTVSWKVTFQSSNTLVGNSTHCETTTMTITN